MTSYFEKALHKLNEFNMTIHDKFSIAAPSTAMKGITFDSAIFAADFNISTLLCKLVVFRISKDARFLEFD